MWFVHYIKCGFFFFFISREEKDNCPNDSICLGPFQQCVSVWLAGCWFWCGLMLHFERLWVMKQEKSISPCHVFAFSACVYKRACQRDWVEAAVINDVLIPSLVWSDSLWNGCLYVQMRLNVHTIVCWLKLFIYI